MEVNDLRIRELQEGDGEALGRFLESLSPQTEYFFHPYPLEMDAALKFAQRKDILCLVGEIGEKIVAYTWWEPKDADIPSIGICVGEGYRGKGIGRKLMKRLVDKAGKEGKKGLRLTVMKDNHRAIALYKSFGFYIIGEIRDSRGEAWKMLLRINSAKKIFLIPYCHPDWAWTHNRLWHERRYNLVFNEVLDIMAKHPDFRWYLDNYICQLTPFLHRSPDRVEELRKRVKEGKIAVCGGFSNIRPNMVGEETYIRNLIIGKDRFRLLFPEADLSVHADAVDVAVGHPQMPQVLSLAGYRYFVFWRPEVALNHKEIPYEFVWEGLDGSSLIAHRACYGGLCYEDMVPADFRERWDEVVEVWWNKEIAYRTLFSPTGLIWISHGNDDARPLRALYSDETIDLPSFLEEWNKREKNIPMAFATPLEFFEELEKEELPRVKGTLDPCDVCYNAAFGGSLGLGKLRIDTDKELSLAETWCAIEGLLGHQAEESSFLPLWENLLNYSAHATQWLFQDDFNRLYDIALQTIGKTRKRKFQALKNICQHIPERNKEKAIIFNPLPYPRTSIVPLLFSFPEKIPPNFSLKDGEGREVPYQIVREVGLPGWEIEVVAQLRIPPLGYNTLSLKQGGKVPLPSQEGNFPTLIWQEGEIIGIRAKGIGENIFLKGEEGFGTLKLFRVDVSAPLHMGEILETKKTDWEEVKQIEDGPLRQSFLRKGRVNSHRIEQTVRLYSNEQRIELDTIINWQGEDGFIALCIPLPFEGELIGSTPFGVEGKELSQELYGLVEGSSANIERWRRGAFFAKSFIDWSNGKRGIAYISQEGDRYYIFDEANGSIYHILINSILNCEGWEKDINYQWKGIGVHCFKGSLIFHKGNWKEGKIYERDMLLRYPLEVIYGDTIEGKGLSPSLPPLCSFLSLSPDNLLLIAFYREGKYFQLRFFETKGEEVEAKVELPFVIEEAVPVDFLGNTLKEPEVEVEGNTLYLAVKPWKIITLKLKGAFSAP